MNQKIGTILIIAITAASALIILFIPSWVEKAAKDAAKSPYGTVVLTDAVGDVTTNNPEPFALVVAEPCDYPSVDLTSLVDDGTAITLTFKDVPGNDTRIYVWFKELRGTNPSACVYNFEFYSIGGKAGDFYRERIMQDTVARECWNGTC